MKAFINFSVHEELFHRVAEHLQTRGVTAWSGFVWGEQQAKTVSNRGIAYDPLIIFTRDLLPKIDDGQPPDLDWLARRERELGISLQRMLAAERHLLAGRTFDQIMRMAEVALREIASVYDRARPDVVFSEDIACFHSYAFFAVARERGIPVWCVTSARVPERIAVYSAGLQHFERFEKLYPELLARGLTDSERSSAEDYLDKFRNRPKRPTGMAARGRKPRIELSDASRLGSAAARFFGDRRDPTVVSPMRAVRQRLLRMARVAAADVLRVFEKPVEGERYVFYPLHFQPEASTLVQAPLYVDQLALIRDIAASLPAGHRLYVKEHVSSRGRRPIAYYEEIRQVPSVRLLGPDEDTWKLIREAAAIAVITGTVGWEGLIFDKPVITFGDVFFNLHPSVYRASEVPKDRWYDVFRRATTEHHHDRDAVLAMVAALQHTSYPGFIGNPSTFPEALLPDNVARIADALASEALS
jgi:hypothetical protein